MNDYIWLVYYFAACTVMCIGMCIYYVKGKGYIRVKDIFENIFFSFMPDTNVAMLILAFILLFTKLFGGLSNKVIWERKEND